MSSNKIPSLINGSAGRPKKALAGRKSPCKACGKDILKDESCYDIPNPTKSFNPSRRFCKSCFKQILQKTKDDVVALEAEA